MRGRIESEIRGAGLLGPHASAEYHALVPFQPLVLTREPSNRADCNAVIARTLLLVPCGYIAKEHAAVIAPQMDAGVLWLALVKSVPRPMHYAEASLWMDVRSNTKFKRYALAQGASQALVDCVLAGMFMQEDGQ